MNIPFRGTTALVLSRVSSRSYAKRAKKLKYFSEYDDNRPTRQALQYFDKFYGPIYQANWPSIRLGLQKPNKYCAVVNPFFRSNKVEEQLQKLSAVNLKTQLKFSDHDKSYRNIDNHEHVKSPFTKKESINFESHPEPNIEEEHDENRFSVDSYIPVSQMKFEEDMISEEDYQKYSKLDDQSEIVVENDPIIPFPDSWTIYSFPRGSLSSFPEPDTDSSGLLSYYLLNGASLIPVWVLDVKEGDTVADVCAAPGGKTLSTIYTLKPGSIFANDNSKTRLKRLQEMLKTYVPDSFRDVMPISTKLGNVDQVNGLYDKILLDVPCTNDRQSLSEDDNNYYGNKRQKERIGIPEMQTELLLSSLKLLKLGGSLVYSTCTLSPVQNDGVVHMALMKAYNETVMDFRVKMIRETVEPVSEIMKLNFSPRYGILVVPFLPSNFGPMYVAKIYRNK